MKGGRRWKITTSDSSTCCGNSSVNSWSCSSPRGQCDSTSPQSNGWSRNCSSIRRRAKSGFSLSALMKTPAGERLQMTARALQRLLECPESPARKYLLVECLQAYAPLSDAEKVELTSLLQTPPYEGTLTMIKTIYEEGMEK